jgi:hypothetical protein
MLLKVITIYFISISLAGARRFMHLARAAMSTAPTACHKGVAAPPGRRIDRAQGANLEWLTPTTRNRSTT